MIWSGWKIKENNHVLVNQFYGNFHSKTPSGRKIKCFFRDVKWCFDASWGPKGLGVFKSVVRTEKVIIQKMRQVRNEWLGLVTCHIWRETATETAETTQPSVSHYGTYIDYPRKYEVFGHKLGQHRRRWSNISPIMGECLGFAGMGHITTQPPWDTKLHHRCSSKIKTVIF